MFFGFIAVCGINFLACGIVLVNSRLSVAGGWLAIIFGSFMILPWLLRIFMLRRTINVIDDEWETFSANNNWQFATIQVLSRKPKQTYVLHARLSMAIDGLLLGTIRAVATTATAYVAWRGHIRGHRWIYIMIAAVFIMWAYVVLSGSPVPAPSPSTQTYTKFAE